MKLVNLFLFLIAFGFSHSSYAEINFGYSLEWLCTDADYVVTGELIQAEMCKKAEHKGKGEMMRCAMVVNSWVKSSAKSKKDTVYFAVRCDRNKLIQPMLENKSEVLVFLRQGIQGFSHGEHNYDIFSLDYSFLDRPLIFDFNNLPNLFFDAKNQKVLRTKSAIVAKCKEVAKQYYAFREKHPIQEIKMLKIEAEGEVYDALWQGSASYLYVPDYLFPKALKNGQW